MCKRSMTFGKPSNIGRIYGLNVCPWREDTLLFSLIDIENALPAPNPCNENLVKALKKFGLCVSLIDLPAMTRRQYQYHQAVVLNVADGSIITDTVTP